MHIFVMLLFFGNSKNICKISKILKLKINRYSYIKVCEKQ